MDAVNNFCVRRRTWILIWCMALAGCVWWISQYESRFELSKRASRFIYICTDEKRKELELLKFHNANVTTPSNNNTSPRAVDYSRIPLAFRPKMNETERADMLDLLRIFDQEARAHNLSYFLYGGTLLGLYRHGGLIPWDDDMDVVMHITDRYKMRRVLRQLNGYNVWYSSSKNRYNYQWKFYSTTAQKTTTLPWTWPFLDIFFYNQNTTHIWVHDIYGKAYCAKDLVFPLKDERFENFEVPVPKNVREYLSQSFKISECVSGYWNHKYERAEEPEVSNRRTLCDTLKDEYHFIDRTENEI